MDPLPTSGINHISRDWHYGFIGSLFKNTKVTLISLFFYPWMFAKIDQALNGFIRVLPLMFSSIVYFNTVFNSFKLYSTGLGFNRDFKNHTKTPFQKDCIGNDTKFCEHMNLLDQSEVKTSALKMTSWFVVTIILILTQVFKLFTFVARTRAHNGIRGGTRMDVFKCCVFPLMLVQLASEHEIYNF